MLKSIFMNQPAVSDLIIENGNFICKNLSIASMPNQILIYEVFRIDKGQPLFLDDHLNRLLRGIKNIRHQTTLLRSDLRSIILSLIKESGAQAGNIKIEFCFSDDKVNEHYYKVFFIPTSYPNETMYKEGVVCNFLQATRDNPSIKMANQKFRKLSDSKIEKESIYEAILVNEKGKITEGSRSNLFFIKANIVYTAPKKLVLEGIMRQKVIQIIRELEIPIRFTAISKDKLHLFEACFITGTSPRILPVKSIENITFHVPHVLTARIRILLNNLIDSHITNNLLTN